MTNYHAYPYDFSHSDVPNDKQHLLTLMKSLETGRSVTFSPSIRLSDVFWLDNYYKKMSRGRIYMRRSYLGTTVTAKLIGLPDDMTASVRFDEGIKALKDNIWYYIFLLLVAVLTPLAFVFGMII